MSSLSPSLYVGRGGEKMAWALAHFGLDVAGLVCADLGAHVGGFTDALLRAGAARVHSVDTCYGTFAWTLRRDARVVVHERTNALHVRLHEPVDFVACDVGWTRQAKMLPHAAALLKREPGVRILSLVKPQYEAERGEIVPGAGRVKPEACARIVAAARALGARYGAVDGPDETPFLGGKGKNPEYFMLVRPSADGPDDPGAAGGGARR